MTWQFSADGRAIAPVCYEHEPGEIAAALGREEA